MTGRLPDAAHWKRLTELFDRSLDLDIPARARLLDDECADDPQLRRDLERLLAADAGAGVLDTGGEARARLDEALRGLDDGSDHIGRQIGAYRIERLLGRGGTGRVFLATRADATFEQRVALKLLRPDLIDGPARRRFFDERRVLARLVHPCIARLYDGGLGVDGQPWYAMEYIDGAPLTEWCDARRLPVGERLQLLCKACAAVDFAHRHLVIHRDLKPANILVGDDGVPKLLDFGIAKPIPQPGAQTRSDTRVMTPEYAAPEQLRGATVGTASDVYALGAIAFELLTGCRAFPDPLAARDPPSVLRACAGNDADVRARAAARACTPRVLRRYLRGDLERILRTALDPDPARRYRSADALAQDLQSHLRGQPISLRSDRRYRTGKFVRRHRLGVAASVIGALVLAGMFALALWQARQARMQARQATAVKDFMVAVFANADPSRHPGKPPDARELLDAGAQRLTGQFNHDPATQQDLLDALARSYAGIGAYARAQPLARRALHDVVQRDGARSAQAIAARVAYAELLIKAGQGRQALQQARQVLQATGDRLSEASVRAHLVMANADNLVSDYKDFARQAQQALAQSTALGAAGAHWQALAWYLTAQHQLRTGDFGNARHALRQSIDLFAKTHSATMAEALDARTNLIFLLLHSGHADEALRRYAQLVDAQRRLLGPTHPDFAESLCNYAFVLWDAGHYRQARRISAQARQALRQAREMGVGQHSRSLGILVDIAESSGHLTLAQQLETQSRALADASAPNARVQRDLMQWSQALLDIQRGSPQGFATLQNLHDHPAVAGKPSSHLSDLRREQAHAYAALGRFQQALDVYRAMDGAGAASTSMSAASRQTGHADRALSEGVLLVQLGHYADAQRTLQSVLKTYGNAPGNALAADSAHLWLAWLQVRQGHAAGALAAIDASLAWRRRQLGDDSYLTGEAHLVRAEALARNGQHAAALHEQALARTTLATQLLPGHALRRRAETALPHG